jgi:glycosyltransferase involved in cell wall biosynthesis
MVANNSCLQEIGGDAVAIFSPFNEEELINIAIEIITKDSLRRELVQKGKQRLSQFNWDASANEFVTIVQQAVSKKNII